VTKRRTRAPAKRKRASPSPGQATYLARLRAGEAHVLELVAAGVPLSQTLDALARTFEAQADGMLASILLVEDGARVRHAAAPSLAEAWVRAVDGQPIGPNQGSCGTAAFLKQSVIVADIATDPRWVNYRDAALAAGLRACWSVPIMGPDETVLGTFALYYSEPRRPTPRLLDLAAHASHLATIAIQHHRHQETILESEARARLIVDNALDANVLMNREGIVTGWNARAAAMFGWSADEAVGRKLSGLIIPERFRAQHEQGLKRYVETGRAHPQPATGDHGAASSGSRVPGGVGRRSAPARGPSDVQRVHRRHHGVQTSAGSAPAEPAASLPRLRPRG